MLTVALALALAPSARAAVDALDEVNATRAARGLPPFARDPGLTTAALAVSDYRAQYRIAGHVGGGMGDFAFLPPGTSADAAGCGALEPSWGWAACCTYDSYQYGGAAVTMGSDGRRYMHLFVRGGGAMAGYTTSGYTPTGYPMAAQPQWVGQPQWVYTSGPGYRRGFRR
jgi:hypothetical protein